ncbi:hypothetical protein HMPREF1544_07325 [Mucor circinelloides 1006PhL]|uniref:Uncharacterized protein n=1 Tax=Mucor circinelloides f. circinelloides (strain 1006PhL) TaxID=1220926 RepID=S2J8F2_MUCC1|nr:hypothetical protein HMPREF1544_07325 [Mucor circinelloides 1006PhL]
MTHLELDTTVPLYTTFPHTTAPDQEEPHTKYTTAPLNSIPPYLTEDDRISLATSPTSSWDSSRRSSYSSTSSTSHSLRIKHCKSLPPSNGDKHALYPTKEAAYKRIEWLEEQMRLSRQSNEAIVKNMSRSIQTFLDRRKANDLEPPSFNKDATGSSALYTSTATSDTDNKKSIEKDQGSSQHHAMRLVLDKLTELKHILSQYSASLTLDDAPESDVQSEIRLSTQTIEKWIDGVTEHKQSTKQDLKNVVIPLLVATEREKQRSSRLMEGLSRLSSQKKAAHHDAIEHTKSRIASVQKAFEKQKKQLRQHVQDRLNNSKEEQMEMEQVVDDMRQEMEAMMEELNQSKQQRDRFEQKSKRLQDDLKALQSSSIEDPDFLALQSLLRESETQIDHLEADRQEQMDKLELIKSDFTKEKARIHATHSHQVNALVLEKEELRARLVKAEQTAAIAKSQKAPVDNSELEGALRRTVAERDGELAKARFELEKSQRHSEQLQKINEKQMQLELNTRLNELETSLKSQYRKDFDTYQVQLTREIRNMSGQIVELETELQDLERQHAQDVNMIEKHERNLSRLEKEWTLKSAQWHDRESKLTLSLKTSDQKIATLEKEALVLYGKNLELAQQLGELDA